MIWAIRGVPAPVRRGSLSCVRVEQQGEGRIHGFGLVTGSQFAQHALAFPVFAGEFGDRLVGASLRLMQVRRPQLGPACLESRFGITHGSQRIIHHALTLPVGLIDYRLGMGLGVQQSL